VDSNAGPVGLPEQLQNLGRCLVMGVLNVTPDSFSDGGRWLDPGVAIAHGIDLVRSGADVVDVGGESTRPGAQRIEVAEELRRVLPVIRGLTAAGVVVSVDTMRAEVAAAAVEEGAALINDVSGGLADPELLDFVADIDLPYIAMHWRGHSTVMTGLAHYDDVVGEVATELSVRLSAALAAGIDRDRIVLDPGLGFAKESAHNWALLTGLAQLQSLGQPILIGASRKRFLGELLAADGITPAPEERDRATDAISALAATAGVWCVRVHDVAGSAQAVRVARAWEQGGTA
jgi:dihydropteroate synthase